MDANEYNLRVSEVARAIMHPADDHAEIVKRVRNYTGRHYILTRQRDPNDKRGAFLLSAPDALIAAVLLRVFETGLHDKTGDGNASAAMQVALRLHSWTPTDFNPDYKRGDPFEMPSDAPRDPASHIWETFLADPATAQWTLTVQWRRHVDTGQKECRAKLFREGDGFLGDGSPPRDGWEVTAELVVVLDKLLADLRQRITVLKKAH